jgi:hypothetical protein
MEAIRVNNLTKRYWPRRQNNHTTRSVILINGVRGVKGGISKRELSAPCCNNMSANSLSCLGLAAFLVAHVNAVYP